MPFAPKILRNNQDEVRRDIRNEEMNCKLVDIIENTLILPNSSGLMDISGLKNEKKILREAIVYPILYPHLFTGIYIIFCWLREMND